MTSPRRVEIQWQKRLFDDFFKIDEFIVTHERQNGSMSREERRLVFERGDSAAVLLFNPKTSSVVLVDQFRLPTLVARRRDESATNNGWLTEAVAGMIDPGESPEETIIRETREETGYEIEDPKLICRFFTSPGGTSERIFLYFAQVNSAVRYSDGGGIGDEDIKVVEMPLGDLSERLKKGLIDDPKLTIAAYWLQDYLKEPLSPSTVRFKFSNRPNLVIGYRTGSIDKHSEIDVWVNSENTDMMMDRPTGRTISAAIRYMGANKGSGNAFDDVIQKELHAAVGRQVYVKIGRVFVTNSGMLFPERGVKKIFHVATVEGRPGSGFRANRDDLILCIEEVLKKVDAENRAWRISFSREKLESILIPMIGAGDGGLPSVEVAEVIIKAAIQQILSSEVSTLKEIYFLAFKPLDRSACERVFSRYCAEGILNPLA
jgi:nudix-type nucleoside diphosphatase (YffH/AdpP family)